MSNEQQEPVFNTAGLSRKFSKQLSRLQIRMATEAMLISGTTSNKLTPAQQQAANVKKLEAAETLFKLEDERDELLATILVSVPDDWVIDGAPDELDWTDVESLNWVKAAKFDELILLALGSIQASAKN